MAIKPAKGMSNPARPNTSHMRRIQKAQRAA
jgi:hypothetical protein